MNICFSSFITRENIDFLGFTLSGLGALFFFFIYALIATTSVVTGSSGKYLTHNVSIRKYWMKNNIQEDKSNFVECQEDSEEFEKSDWSVRKKFAFWSIDKGATWCFGLVAIGFILQLISKLL